MPHINEAPWDQAACAKLATAPYATMPSDDGGPLDGAIAVAMSAEPVDGPDVLPLISDIVTYLRTEGRWLGIKAAAAAGTSVAAMAAVDIATDLRQTRIDLNLPLVKTMLTSLANDIPTGAGATLIDGDDLAAITAMKSTKVEYWQSIDATSPFNQHDIPRFRAWSAS